MSISKCFSLRNQIADKSFVLAINSLMFATTLAAGALMQPEEITALVKAGKFADAEAELTKITQLNHKSPAAAPYNFADVELLDAECKLQLHKTKLAGDMALRAMKEAEAANDPDKAAGAASLAEYIFQSVKEVYIIRSGADRGKKINITTVRLKTLLP